MKNLFLLLLICSSIFAKAQSKSETQNHCIQKAEVCILMDATGSMEQVMKDLKVNLNQIRRELDNGFPNWEFEFGAVLFRDKQEEYETRIFNKTSDFSSLKRFFDNQYAVGGGDESESFQAGLDKVINQIKWSDDLNPKVVLVLTDNDFEAKLLSSSEELTAKGIKVIPIKYEFPVFGFCGMTSREVIERYITENSPKNPTAADLVRLITEKINDFVFDENCSFETEEQVNLEKIEAFPNPAVNFFTLTLPEGIWQAELQNTNAETLISKQVQNGHKWQVSKLTPGVYFLKLSKGEDSGIKKIIIAGR